MLLNYFYYYVPGVSGSPVLQMFPLHVLFRLLVEQKKK